MRKVTKKVMAAFIAGKSANCGNTTTDGNEVRLFGNRIIRRDENGQVWASSCGWLSSTTKERLNGFFALYNPSYRITQNNYAWKLCSSEYQFNWNTQIEYKVKAVG